MARIAGRYDHVMVVHAAYRTGVGDIAARRSAAAVMATGRSAARALRQRCIGRFFAANGLFGCRGEVGHKGLFGLV